MQVLPARGSIAMHVCERSRRALEAGPARTILEAFAIYAQLVDIQAGRVRLLEIGARARLTVAVPPRRSFAGDHRGPWRPHGHGALPRSTRDAGRAFEKETTR